MRILHVVDTLAADAPSRQIEILAPLQARAAEVTVLCLGSGGQRADALRTAGVNVVEFRRIRGLDFRCLSLLHSLLRKTAPDVVHAWRLTSLRMLALTARPLLGRTIVAQWIPQKGKLAWWDRKLLSRVASAVVAGPSESEWAGRLPTAKKIRVVEIPGAVEVPEIEIHRQPGRVVVAGPMTKTRGTLNALFGVDILSKIVPNIELCFAGSGPEEATIREWARDLELEPCIRYLGADADARRAMASADCVWIPSHGNAGGQVAIESMAMGIPVVASRMPCLNDCIEDGVTGSLVPPRDSVAIAKRTLPILRDEAFRAQMASSAKQYVTAKRRPAIVLEKWNALFDHVAAGTASVAA